LGKVIDWVLHGVIDPRVSNAATSAANALIGAYVKCDLEARIAELEKAARASKPTAARSAGGGR
jgi:hypothetical protein